MSIDNPLVPDDSIEIKFVASPPALYFVYRGFACKFFQTKTVIIKIGDEYCFKWITFLWQHHKDFIPSSIPPDLPDEMHFYLDSDLYILPSEALSKRRYVPTLVQNPKSLINYSFHRRFEYPKWYEWNGKVKFSETQEEFLWNSTQTIVNTIDYWYRRTNLFNDAFNSVAKIKSVRVIPNP